MTNYVKIIPPTTGYVASLFHRFENSDVEIELAHGGGVTLRDTSDGEVVIVYMKDIGKLINVLEDVQAAFIGLDPDKVRVDNSIARGRK